MDGNFQQVRKANPYDQDDICLSDGHKYFVQDKPYKDFLQVHGGRPTKGQAEVGTVFIYWGSVIRQPSPETRL